MNSLGNSMSRKAFQLFAKHEAYLLPPRIPVGKHSRLESRSHNKPLPHIWFGFHGNRKP